MKTTYVSKATTPEELFEEFTDIVFPELKSKCELVSKTYWSETSHGILVALEAGEHYLWIKFDTYLRPDDGVFSEFRALLVPYTGDAE